MGWEPSIFQKAGKKTIRDSKKKNYSLEGYTLCFKNYIVQMMTLGERAIHMLSLLWKFCMTFSSVAAGLRTMPSYKVLDNV